MKNIKVLMYMILINILLAATKIVIGYFGASQALVVDGLDSFADTLVNIIGIIAIKHSMKEADSDHPFGHGNSEYITTMLVSVFIMASAGLLIYSLLTHTFVMESHPTMLSMITLIVTLGIKVVVAITLYSVGKRNKNSLIKALGIENLSDIPKAVVALVGILLALFNVGFEADMYAGVIIAMFILFSGIKMFIDSYNDLLGKSAEPEVIKDIEMKATLPGVVRVNSIKSIKKGPYYILMITIVVDGNMNVHDAHEICFKIKQDLLSEGTVKHVSVHVDPSF